MPESGMPVVPVKIVGAGISGLVLGQCLRRRKIPSVIFERIQENPTRNNYGITLYNTTYRPLLETLGLPEDEFKRKVAVHNPKDNGAVADKQALRVNRCALTRLLQQGLDIRWEHKLESVNQINGSQGSVSFNTDSGNQTVTEDYQVLVGADGVHSGARSSLSLPASSFSLNVLPYIVFNGKRRIQFSELPPRLLNCFESPNGISHNRGGAVLSIKADFWDAEKQIVAVSYTMSRAAGDDDKPLLERNISDASTIAKQFVKEIAALGQLPEPFDQVFNPNTMEEDRLLHWLMRSAELDLGTAKKLAESRGIVLLGDAAHPQPIPGEGANTAIKDAMVLASHVEPSGKIQGKDFDFLQDLHCTWTEAKQKTEQDLQNLQPRDAQPPKTGWRAMF